MKKTTLLFSIISIFSISCNSRLLNNHLPQAIKDAYQAENCDVMFMSSANAEENDVEVTLTNPDKKLMSQPIHYITSGVASMVLDSLTAEDMIRYPSVKVTVVHDGKTSSLTYTTKQLQSVKNDVKLIHQFLDFEESGDSLAAKKLTDPMEINDSSFADITATMAKLGSTYGKISHIFVLGFATGSFAGTEEPITLIYTRIINGSSGTRYTFYINKDQKIVSLGFNEKME